MKYVMTKDAIWLFGGTHAKGQVIIGKKREIDFGFCLDKEEIIDESDNLEDLFDWIVLKRDGGIRLLSDTLDNAIAYAGNDFLSYEVIGAIETDESLKYVAKMKWSENDDKWGWELL